MGDDELAVLILSGWSDGPLPALEHSLRQRGLRCVRVPVPMPPCGVYWCANPFLLLLAGVVWLAIYAWNECKLEPFVVFAILIIAGALVAARLCVAGVVRFAEWHGAANAKRLLARHRVALVVGFSWGGGIAHRLLASRSWRGPTLLLAPTTVAMARCSLRSPQRPTTRACGSSSRATTASCRAPRRRVSTRPSPSSTTTTRCAVEQLGTPSRALPRSCSPSR